MLDSIRRYKAGVFQALGHPTRIAIVELLNDGVSHPWDAWSAPNSLREVEREVNFLLDVTDPNRDSAPDYVLQTVNAPVPSSAFEDDFADDDRSTAPAMSE